MTTVICTDLSEDSLNNVRDLLKTDYLPVLVFGDAQKAKSLAKDVRTEVYFFSPQACETNGDTLFFTYVADCFVLKMKKEIESVSDLLLLEQTSDLIPSFLWEKAILTFEAEIQILTGKTLWE